VELIPKAQPGGCRAKLFGIQGYAYSLPSEANLKLAKSR
jgi:hypothetical protein